MLFFLLKKSFFDYWDNLFKLLCVNLCLALLVALYIQLSFLRGGAYLGLVIIYLFNLLIGVTSVAVWKISDYDLPQISLFLLAAKTVWKDALFFTACFVLQASVLHHIIPFYLKLDSRFAGLSMAMLVFWVCAIWWVAMIYYYPLRLRLNFPVLKAARMSLMFLTDNFSLSLSIFLISSALLMLSLVTTMLLPGISFVLALHQVAGRTLLLKYDYLARHQPANKKEIPWGLLLKDDLDIVGRRSLKEIVFPWKE
jgi:hypothetical protein